MIVISPMTRILHFQFSLRTLLVLFVVVSCPMSLFAVRLHRAQEQKKTVETIQSLGGSVYYEHQLHTSWTWEPNSPIGLRHIVGNDFFQRAVYVDLSDNVVHCLRDAVRHTHPPGTFEALPTYVEDDSLVYLTRRPSIESLYLSNTPISDAGLGYISQLSNLKILNLENTLVTDKGVEKLQRALPFCKIER